MILQIHHQNKKHPGQTDFCFQFISESAEHIRTMVQKAWDEYPPPEGYQFLMCNEESDYFVNQPAADDTAKEDEG